MTNSAAIKYVEEEGRRYAIRNGKRFEIETVSALNLAKTQRKAFEPDFAKIPTHWVKTLERAKSINAYRLALRILLEAFQRDRIGGEIVLSAEMTNMSRSNRHRAAKELERLGLIKLS